MRRRYDLVSQKKNAKLSRAIDRWQIRRLVGTSGHTHQCCGGGCVPPSRALRSCSALPLWTLRVFGGSRSAWALRGRRWRCCPPIVIGRTFSTRADAFIGGLMFGEHLILETHRISLCLHYDVHRNIDKDMAWILPLLAENMHDLWLGGRGANKALGRVLLEQNVDCQTCQREAVNAMFTVKNPYSEWA